MRLGFALKADSNHRKDTTKTDMTRLPQIPAEHAFLLKSLMFAEEKKLNRMKSKTQQEKKYNKKEADSQRKKGK